MTFVMVDDTELFPAFGGNFPVGPSPFCERAKVIEKAGLNAVTAFSGSPKTLR